MKTVMLALLSLVLAAVLVAAVSTPKQAEAAGTVGSGSPGSCTETALNEKLSGGGLVTFNCGADPVTISLSSQKVITQSIAIDGGGKITLSGGGATRLFSISDGASLSLSNLTLNNGSASQGGAIGNSGSLDIRNSSFDNNQAPGRGGAINNLGSLTIRDSTFFSNTASGGYGGGLYNGGSLTITGSTFYTNTAGNGGGGIYNSGSVTIAGSAFAGNTVSAGKRGGGIYNDLASGLTIDTSTLANNSAPGGLGGGIYNNGRLFIIASTMTGNAAGAGLGGGINSDISGTVAITNSTFSGNFGGFAGGGLIASGIVTVTNSTFYSNTAGGMVNDGSRLMAVRNTIVANNTSYDCSGTITSLGHNLESADTCAFALTGDLSNTDPLLGPLANNGGKTLSHALLPGSPAINAGDNSGCPATDQRGVPRPQFGTCDIGAYELVLRAYLPVVLAASPSSGQTMYGVQAHWAAVYNDEPGLQRTANAIDDLGLGWTKMQVRWGEEDYYYDCSGSLSFDWNHTNQVVNAASSMGLRVLFSVVTSPPCTHPWTNDVEAPPDNPNVFAAFVGELALRYAGRGIAIEIWEQENTTQNLDATRYTQMLAASYNKIKAADPNIIVIGGAPAPYVSGGDTEPLTYLQQMKAAGADHYMDCIGVLFNDSVASPDSSPFMSFLQGYQAQMGKQACITSFGVASEQNVGHIPGIDLFKDNTEANQADWTTRAMALARQSGGRMIILFNLDYGPLGGLNENALYSFFTPNFYKRPVYGAVKNWCATNGCR